MHRVNKILEHNTFREELNKIEHIEKDRKFCRHGMYHLLDVARIGYITILEKNLPYSKELIYAAALLHDLGKGIQYETGIPHQEAGAELAEPVLLECGFQQEEIHLILDSIRYHRTSIEGETDSFRSVLYVADKKSRACYTCQAFSECNWSEEKKNHQIIV